MATRPVHTINVMEHCRVSPPAGSVAETSLPLTFFDLIWLRVNVVVRSVSFFELSDCKVQTHLPYSKQSLSLALQRFYPLAGALRLSPQTGEYEIHYTDGDSVPLTVVESDSDFYELVMDHPRDMAEFLPLVAELPASDLISLQLTVITDSGFSIGLAVPHVVADGHGIMNFMRHWGSICRLGHESDSMSLLLPLHDRALIPDPNGLKRIFLDHVKMAMAKQGQNQQNLWPVQAQSQHMVRATFVLTRAKIEELRQRVTMAREGIMEEGGEKKPIHVSSFVLMCARVWVCLTKARAVEGDQMVLFGFGVDCRGRMRMAQPIPATYFGNCVTMCIVSARGSDIAMGDDADGGGGARFMAACEAISGAIQRFDDDDGVLGRSDGWFRRLLSIMEAGERIISVAGSPRLGFYDMDFGSGRPSKVVVTSIEQRGGISLAESRDDAGRGLEVGVALPKHEMEQFTYYYDKGLKNY
ncbi:hypothetical protein MRB53_000093 [Persea americana]|uniref:Uncharacterized protein n=1 Tax=Persea americana TaxID=3435 RepID=A0ACC2MN46_PERAE|nr:hypothetical protein MRB53_000093 [Persea americana]